MPEAVSKKNLIVLIHPGYVSGETPYAPFELMFLATYLEGKGFEVIIIDQRAETDWERRLLEVIDRVLWVGLTVITGPKILYALETSRRIKEFRQDIPIVFGGWHPTFVPDQTVAHPLVDYVVCGIGELKVADLSEHIRNGQGGVINSRGILQKNSVTTYTVEKERIDWLQARPGYHLVDIERYRSENNIAGIITARGCPFHCSFCTISQISYLNRGLDSVVEEIEFLVREKGFKFISYADGLFFAQKLRVMQLIDMIEERNLVFEWNGSLRPNTWNRYTESEIERLKQSGLVQVFVGAETGSPRMLKRIMKGTTVEDVIHLARLTGKHGIKLSATFLCGLPYETVEDLRDTIVLVHKIRELNPNIKILNPFYMPIPGSPAYYQMLELGWQPPNSLEEWGHRTKWGRTPEEIEPFPWLSRREFDSYMDTFRNSILQDLRVINVLDRQ